MRKVLDKLMARQMRLMGSLDSASHLADEVAPRHAAATSIEIDAEHSAVDAALSHLAAGDPHAAEALLAPYEESARLPRTLTTLARMRSREDDPDAALALLLRAEALDPTDRKVWYFLAELFYNQQRHAEELGYRRRFAYAKRDGDAQSYISLLTAIVKAAPKGKQPLLAEIRLLAGKLKTATDMSDAQRIMLARALYGVDPLVADAVAHYQAADPCPADQQELSPRWISLVEWCKQTSAPLHGLPTGGVRGRRPVLAELRDVWVLPRLRWLPVVGNGQAILANFATEQLKERAADAANPLLLQNERHAMLRVPRNRPRIDSPALLIGGVGTYQSDTLDHVGSLAIAHSLGIGTELPIVVNGDIAPHQVELLELLGYGQDRLIRVGADQAVAFDHLLVPTRLVIGDQWVDPLLPQWLRNRLAPATALKAATTKLLLVAAGHALDVDGEVIDLLQSLGYQRIQPKLLSVREQIDRFAVATHVVALGDADLTNMVYAPSGASITIFQHHAQHEAEARPRFYALADACGHKIASIPATVSGSAKGSRFDVTAVRDAMRQRLQFS